MALWPRAGGQSPEQVRFLCPGGPRTTRFRSERVGGQGDEARRGYASLSPAASAAAGHSRIRLPVYLGASGQGSACLGKARAIIDMARVARPGGYNPFAPRGGGARTAKC